LRCVSTRTNRVINDARKVLFRFTEGAVALFLHLGLYDNNEEGLRWVHTGLRWVLHRLPRPLHDGKWTTVGCTPGYMRIVDSSTIFYRGRSQYLQKCHLDKQFWEDKFTQSLLGTALHFDSLVLLFDLAGSIETVPSHTPYIVAHHRKLNFGAGRGDWVFLARVYKECFCYPGTGPWPCGHIYRYLHTSFLTLRVRRQHDRYLLALNAAQDLTGDSD
jgi:hypothetical protein